MFFAILFCHLYKHHYSYRLIGFDRNWSKWTKEAFKDYTNLSAGEYTFEVKAKDDFDQISEADRFSFHILNPWYWTVLARIIYTLMLFYLIYLTVQIRSKSLRKRAKSLELIVDERTKEIQDQAEQLKLLDKAKSTFFANISHEFRTPLTLIMGQLERIKRESSNEKSSAYADSADKQSRHLLSLINQLLDLSKLESGQLELKASESDILDFLKIQLTSFESYAEAKSINYSVHSDCDSLPYIFDAKKIQSVIVNLLSNAFKFTEEEGEIEIHISCQDFLRVEVRDSGYGIPEEKIPYVFDRFYQVDNSMTRQVDGSGIGLTLVKEIIELHHGSIEVKSTYGKGSSFIFTLPLKSKLAISQEFMEIEALLDHEVESKLEEQNEVQLAKLLIVEDNSDLRHFIVDILSSNYNCIEAKNGEDALKIAQVEEIKLILSDVMMPKMDGFELCKRIKSTIETSHIPFILLTARSDEEDKLSGLELGADSYLTKPFNELELKQRIANLIDVRRILREKYASNILTPPDEFTATKADQLFLDKLNKAILENIEKEDFDRNMLANKMAKSLSTLQRKLKSLTDMPLAEYIRTTRLKRAAELLEVSTYTITEIAFMVGFKDSTHFSHAFKKQFSMSPKEYREANG